MYSDNQLCLFYITPRTNKLIVEEDIGIVLVNGGTELIDDVMVEVVDLVAVTDTTKSISKSPLLVYSVLPNASFFNF